jgi:hypothetical protein
LARTGSWLATAALALAACTTPPGPDRSLPQTRPLGRPAVTKPSGTLRLLAAGLEIEPRYGTFERIDVYTYDTAGLNVGIGYTDRSAECTVVATFYVYPTPSASETARAERASLEAEFANVRAEIAQFHPRMTSPEAGAASRRGRGAALDGASLTFRDMGTFSELLLFVADRRWFLKYRFTYREECRDAVRPRIDALVAALPAFSESAERPHLPAP